MTDSLPFPLPAGPSVGASPRNPAIRPAEPKVAPQREFSPVLDDARAVVDRRQPPAERPRTERDIDNDHRPERDPQDKPAETDRAEASADDAVETDDASHPTDRSTTAEDETPKNDADGTANETAASDAKEHGAAQSLAATVLGLTAPQPEPHPLQVPSDTEAATVATVDQAMLPTDLQSTLEDDALVSEVDANAGDGLADSGDTVDGITVAGEGPTSSAEGEMFPTAPLGSEATAAPATPTATGADTAPTQGPQGQATKPAVTDDSTGSADDLLISELQPLDSAESETTDLETTPETPAPETQASDATIDGSGEQTLDSPARTNHAEASGTTPSASRADAPSLTNASSVVPDVRAATAPEPATAKFNIADMVPAGATAETDEAQGELWGQVQRALARARLGAEGQELRVRLRPAELGELLVQVRTNGEQLSVRLVASSGAAHQTLLNDQSRLAAELRSAGFENGSVDISQQDQQQGDPNQRSGGGSASGDRPSPASPLSMAGTGEGRALDSHRMASASRPRGGLVDLTL